MTATPQENSEPECLEDRDEATRDPSAVKPMIGAGSDVFAVDMTRRGSRNAKW